MLFSITKLMIELTRGGSLGKGENSMKYIINGFLLRLYKSSIYQRFIEIHIGSS